MDKIEKIRQEIERHRQAIRVLNEHTAPEQISKTCTIFQYSDTILSALLSFIDSQPQEPITSRMEGFLEGLTSAKNNYQEGYMDGYSAAKKEIYKDLYDKMEKYRASQVIHIEMPKEPSEDLEEEITYFNEWMKHNGLVLNTAAIAHYFAKWGAEHLKK